MSILKYFKFDKVGKRIVLALPELDLSSASSISRELIDSFKDLFRFVEDGYIKESETDLPVLLEMIKNGLLVDYIKEEEEAAAEKMSHPVKRPRGRPRKQQPQEKTSSSSSSSPSFSVYTNSLAHNACLLMYLSILDLLEKFIKDCNPISIDIDLIHDIKFVRHEIKRLLNPYVREKITSRGIRLYLNTYVGYDSEYELNSSLKQLNNLISVQLAGTTDLIVKIPIVGVVNSINFDRFLSEDLNNGRINKVDDPFNIILENSIYNLINSYSNNISGFAILNNVVNKIEENEKEVKSGKSSKLKYSNIARDSNYIYLKYPKTSVRTQLKLLNTYSSKELFEDGFNLCKEDHTNNINNFIEETIPNSSEKIQAKLRGSYLDKNSKSQYRLTYREDYLRLSITVNKRLYISMHESTADLSVLKDFNELKNSLDLVNRSFVTLCKPLSYDWLSAKVFIRDTILLAPVGAKSLASLGNIYGESYRKIDIGKYRNKINELLRDDKELFSAYAIRDAEITLKHACSMEEFNFTLCKLGVPLTLSSIGKAYVIKE